MRLLGSKTEQDFRDVLIKSHKSLFKENSYGRLLKVLQMHFHGMKTAYFIRHIPEQGEDLYTMLINVDTIVKIEISRCNLDEQPVIEIINIDDFKRKLTKVEQIKLMVAINLAKKDMEYDF